MKSIELVELLPDELKLDFGNPRVITKESMEKLKTSMVQFGDFGVVVINENNQVLSGNQRVKAILELGLDGKISCKKLVGYSEEEQKAINIRANRLSGEFDSSELNKWLEELADVKFDLSLTGFEIDMNINTEAYDPVLNPGQNNSSFSDKDIQNAQDKLDGMNTQNKATSVTCPKCGHDFEFI